MTSEDDEALTTLLRWAGRRPAPPGEITTAVYQHSRRAWLALVQRRKALRRGFAWAAGLVAIVLAGGGGWNVYPHQVMASLAPGQVATITHTLWHPLAGGGGGNLYLGDAIETGAEGAVLHRPDGNTLSLGGHTRLSFISSSTVRLWHGRLYVQSYGVPHSQSLVVSTDLGSVEHHGTQFLVEREDAGLTVAVRDGRVIVHSPRHEAVELLDGQAARVDPSGQLQRWDLAAFDNIWDWADGLASPLIIDGQSLYAVLSQIAQRSGLVLHFSAPAAESEARKLALHGAPLALQPRFALAAVLATTTLSGTTAGREILISAR